MVSEAVSKKQVIERLKKVLDPEINIDVVSMGLIYGVRVESGSVYVKMTLTNPACPMAAPMVGMVEEAIRELEGVKDVNVELVWDPPWNPSMMRMEEKKER